MESIKFKDFDIKGCKVRYSLFPEGIKITVAMESQDVTDWILTTSKYLKFQFVEIHFNRIDQEQADKDRLKYKKNYLF